MYMLGIVHYNYLSSIAHATSLANKWKEKFDSVSPIETNFIVSIWIVICYVANDKNHNFQEWNSTHAKNRENAATLYYINYEDSNQKLLFAKNTPPIQVAELDKIFTQVGNIDILGDWKKLTTKRPLE